MRLLIQLKSKTVATRTEKPPERVATADTEAPTVAGTAWNEIVSSPVRPNPPSNPLTGVAWADFSCTGRVNRLQTSEYFLPRRSIADRPGEPPRLNGRGLLSTAGSGAVETFSSDSIE
jgi:hypothetical protein